MIWRAWRTKVRSRFRQAELLTVRIVAVLLVGWVSGVVGLWQAEPAAMRPLPLSRDDTAGSVAYAAPPGQEAEATPTPEGGEVVSPATDPSGTTPTPTIMGGPPPAPALSPSPSPIPYTGDLCFGDEQVSFVPEEPRADNELLIAVSSRYPNKYPRLAGTEKTTFMRERPGQIGYVWEWTIQVTWPGQHHYVFYVDSTIPCKKVDIVVKRQIPTATPTKTPEPDNENQANNDNNT